MPLCSEIVAQVTTDQFNDSHVSWDHDFEERTIPEAYFMQAEETGTLQVPYDEESAAMELLNAEAHTHLDGSRIRRNQRAGRAFRPREVASSSVVDDVAVFAPQRHRHDPGRDISPEFPTSAWASELVETPASEEFEMESIEEHLAQQIPRTRATASHLVEFSDSGFEQPQSGLDQGIADVADPIAPVVETPANIIELASADVFLMMYQISLAMLGRPAVAGAIAAEVLHQSSSDHDAIGALDQTIARSLGVAARTIESAKSDEVPHIEARRIIWRELAVSSTERRRVLALKHLLVMPTLDTSQLLGIDPHVVDWIAADSVTAANHDIEAQILAALAVTPSSITQSSCAQAAAWLHAKTAGTPSAG